MKKLYPLFVVLLLTSNGFGQKQYEAIKTYDNGNIKSIGYHKKTKNRIVKNGKEETYFYHGVKKSERTYRNGILDGLFIRWDENGLKESEVTYKDGKLDGLSIRWYENGQKEYERTIKDGKYDGLWTEWYNNGQKKREASYKEGFEISEKRWNEDGSVRK